MSASYSGFLSWAEVLRYAGERDAQLFYHAPMDFKPQRVHVKRVKARLRVIPNPSFADPFWADSGHLDRFKRLG